MIWRNISVFLGWYAMAVLFSLRSSLSILFAMRDRRDENIFSGLGQQLLAIDRSIDPSMWSVRYIIMYVVLLWIYACIIIIKFMDSVLGLTVTTLGSHNNHNRVLFLQQVTVANIILCVVSLFTTHTYMYRCKKLGALETIFCHGITALRSRPGRSVSSRPGRDLHSKPALWECVAYNNNGQHQQQQSRQQRM